MPKVQLIDGKFYRDGKQEPPMLGDPDQLKALKHNNWVKEALAKGQYLAIISESQEHPGVFMADHTCTCGRQKTFSVQKRIIRTELLVAEKGFHNVDFNCGGCGTNWKAKALDNNMNLDLLIDEKAKGVFRYLIV
jgi:hypothetical protein